LSLFLQGFLRFYRIVVFQGWARDSLDFATPAPPQRTAERASDMPQLNLTAASVAAIKAATSRVDYWGTHVSGVGVRVTPIGVKTWCLWFRLNGRTPARWTIGRYPALSLADARDHAHAPNGKMASASSFDPRAAKLEARVSATVTDFAADYSRLHAQPNKKSWKKDQGRINLYILPAWRHRLVRDIKRQDVQRLIDHVADPNGRNAPQAAVNLRRMLSRMFSWALARDFAIEYSPVQGTKPPAKNSRRKRYLVDAEIAALLSASCQRAARPMPCAASIGARALRRPAGGPRQLARSGHAKFFGNSRLQT
jgi:hypothetical protein